MSVTNNKKANRGQVNYVNYNIRFQAGWGSPTAEEVVRWIEDNRIDGQLFKSFDGGGSGSLILERQCAHELVQFCRDC